MLAEVPVDGALGAAWLAVVVATWFRALAPAAAALAAALPVVGAAFPTWPPGEATLPWAGLAAGAAGWMAELVWLTACAAPFAADVVAALAALAAALGMTELPGGATMGAELPRLVAAGLDAARVSVGWVLGDVFAALTTLGTNNQVRRNTPGIQMR